MKILFSKKPIPIPAEYRPIYKIAQLLLILRINSRGNKCSLIKLHLFSWALKDINNRESLELLLKSERKEFSKIRWTIEPALNRALDFMVAEKLCDIVSKSYKLTDFGINLADQIINMDDVLIKDKVFLSRIGKKFSEAKVTEVANFWLNL